LQPAGVHHFKALENSLHPADCKSAIQQVENLRYDDGLPGSF
jgi:hypothetical protein